MRTRHLAILAAVLAGAAAAGPTGSEGPPIRADDLARIAARDSATGRALGQLLAEGDDDQIALGITALRGRAQPADSLRPEALAGDWSCRMTKIGGLLPAVAYPPFRCRLTPEGPAIRFEKLTGSQRTAGEIRRDGDHWIYLGSSFVAGEAPRPYEAFPAALDTDATETLPDAGLLEQVGPDRLRLVLPLPYRESLLNVLTLSR